MRKDNMKISKLIYLYRKQNKGRWISWFVLVVLFAVAITLIQLAILDMEENHYGIRIVEKIIPERNQLYNVRLNTPERGGDMMLRLKEFTDELIEIEEVAAAGRYYETHVVFDELQMDESFLKVNRQLMAGTLAAEYPEILSIVYLDKSLLSYFSMEKLPHGKTADAIPVMAGYAYKDYIKPGAVYTDVMSGKQYEVVGILPQNCMLPPFVLFHSELYQDMDVSLFAVYEDRVDEKHDYISNYAESIYFYSNGSKECTAKVEKLAEEKNLRIKMDTVEDYIREAEKDNRIGMEMTFLFTVIAVVSGFIAMVSASVIRIILQKQQYGILYANGVSYRDTAKLFAIDHGIKLVIAFVLAVIVSWRYLTAVVMTNLSDVLKLFFCRVLGESLLLVVLLFGISVVVPIRLLSQLKVAELLGGNEL